MDYNVRSAAPGGRARRAGMSAAVAALLLIGSVAGWTAAGSGVGNASAAPSAPVVSTSTDRTIGASRDSYAGIVEQISPAVVTIRSERRVRKISQQIPDDPLFRQFFGDRFGGREMPSPREDALGSGVVVRPDGYILTNNHVVDGADQVTVELSDGRSMKATVVGTDAASDLAVLKIDGKSLHTLALGDSDAVRVGDVVLAVGNPLGLGQTVTMGIVSAKGRATEGTADGSFEDFIQTDAPINHGNSGGALVSTRGELIGINSQILSPTPAGGNIGIGFAIPANMARNVMTQLVEHGTVRRGMMGVTIQPVTSDIARSLGLHEVRGALVNSVTAGGPASQAGIRQGDVITAVNGEPVKDGNVLRNDIAQLMPGAEAKITLLRNGSEQMVTVKLGELKVATARRDGGESPAADGTGFGMSVAPLTSEIAGELGVQARTGVVIEDVQPSGRAGEAGLRRGDVIAQVDGKPVATVEALRGALGAGDRPALLLVHRGATTFYLTLDRAGK